MRVLELALGCLWMALVGYALGAWTGLFLAAGGYALGAIEAKS